MTDQPQLLAYSIIQLTKRIDLKILLFVLLSVLCSEMVFGQIKVKAFTPSSAEGCYSVRWPASEIKNAETLCLGADNKAAYTLHLIDEQSALSFQTTHNYKGKYKLKNDSILSLRQGDFKNLDSTFLSLAPSYVVKAYQVFAENGNYQMQIKLLVPMNDQEVISMMDQEMDQLQKRLNSEFEGDRQITDVDWSKVQLLTNYFLLPKKVFFLLESGKKVVN